MIWTYRLGLSNGLFINSLHLGLSVGSMGNIRGGLKGPYWTNKIEKVIFVPNSVYPRYLKYFLHTICSSIRKIFRLSGCTPRTLRNRVYTMFYIQE